MADNVIRRDIIEIGWDVKPSPLDDIAKETQKFQKAFEKFGGNQQKLKAFSKEMGKLNAQRLTGLSKSIDNVTRKIGTGLVSASKKAVKAIATIGTAAAGAGFAGAMKGVNYNAEMETYQTSFEVMTGSAEKAQKTVQKLQKMGASTPFEMTDLADTTQLLMNYGFTADDAINRMSMLGDIAQGDADKMNRIATAYGQMSSAGKVSLEDVKQMIESGFNPLQEISSTTGESMASLYDRISKGKISVNEITASMQRSTSEGGKYFKSMEKQSKTFSGQMSTMKDNFNQLLGSMTAGLTDKLSETVLPKINGFIGRVSSAFESRGFAGVFDLITQKLGPVGTAMQTVVDKVKAFVSNKEKMQILKDIFGSIKSAVEKIAPVLGQVVSGVWDFVTSTGVLKGVKTIFEGINKAVGWVKDNFELVKEVVIAVGGGFLIFGAAVKVVTIAVGAYNAVMKIVKTVQLIAAASQLGFNAAMLACPVTWIVGAIVGLIAVIILLVRNWDKVKEVGAKCWDKLKEVWGKVSNWFNTKVVEPVKKYFSGLWSDISEKVANVKTNIVDAFQTAKDKVTSAWGNIKDFFSGIWTDAVKAVAKPVNKIIGGANWVLEKLGSDKKFEEWQPYARGTNGHPGGNAIVNDGRGAELVQMPNGYTFIPKGRNVGIPNAPKGMKVLDAQRTAKLMGKSSPTFNYEEGTGWDIWSFFDNVKGLVGKVIDKFISFKNMSGFALDVGKAMVSKATDAMGKWVSGLFDSMGGKSLASYEASKGVKQWESTVAQALKMEGLHSADNIKRTLYQMQTESGGNPRAINNWDVNAKNGTPSKGLMQVIDPTFKAYARKGYNSNIYDPLSNILASVRYARSRYGSLAKAYRGVGYEGGIGFPSMRLPSYSPASSVPVSSTTSNNTNNNYNPSFNLTMHGTVDRTTQRVIKQWVKEALEETFDGIKRANPRVTEV